MSQHSVSIWASGSDGTALDMGTQRGADYLRRQPDERQGIWRAGVLFSFFKSSHHYHILAGFGIIIWGIGNGGQLMGICHNLWSNCWLSNG